MKNFAIRARAFLGAWLDAVPFPKQKKPTVIQFPINNVCNSGCQMCDIWRQKKGVEISPEKVREVLCSPFFDQVTAIGFNGGEPTLRKDFKELVSAAIDSLPQLAWVSLITNAIIPGRVRACIDDLAEICSVRGVKLDVMVSVDGIGSVHDRVRGKNGNFATAEKIVEYITRHPGVDSARIGCTVIRENVYDVENVLAWAQAKGIYARFRCGIPHQRLYTNGKSEPFAFTADESFYFCNFLDELRQNYEKDPVRSDFYLSLRNQIAYRVPRRAGCAWKNKGVTILSDGGFAYCAVSSPILGNIHEQDAGQLYWENSNILKEINESKCSNCRHDYEGISSRKILLKGAASRLAKRYPTFSFLLRRARVVVETIPKLLPKPTIHAAKSRSRCTLSESRRFLVVGWYGTETLGDKAILGGLICAIREAAGNVPIDIASLECYVTEYTKLQMPELTGTAIITLAEAEVRLKTGIYSDFVFGGGPLMSAIPQMLDISRLAKLAKALGAKVFIAGCGIGPMGIPRGDRAIKQLLFVADRIVVRDEGSKRIAESLGVKSPISVAVDPAFLWIDSKRTQNARAGKKILLALREWPIHEYAIGLPDAASIRENFDQQVGVFVRSIQVMAPDYEIQPICMHRLAIGGNDRKYYERVLADFPELLAKIPVQHQPPTEDLRVFEEASGILAMRFHSVVFGLATEQAVLAVDYTLGGKIAGVLQDNGYEPPMSILGFDGAQAARCLIERIETCTNRKVDVSHARRVYAEIFK